MVLKSLNCYLRRKVITTTNNKIVFDCIKDKLLIVPGMIIGIRMSSDKRKVKIILNDDITKVYTIKDNDIKILWDNSIEIK